MKFNSQINSLSIYWQSINHLYLLFRAVLIHNQWLCFKRLQMFLQESLGWLNMSCIWLALTLLSAKGHFFPLTDELLAETSGLNIVGIKSVVICFFFLFWSHHAVPATAALLSSAGLCRAVLVDAAHSEGLAVDQSAALWVGETALLH